MFILCKNYAAGRYRAFRNCVMIAEREREKASENESHVSQCHTKTDIMQIIRGNIGTMQIIRGNIGTFHNQAVASWA